MDEPEAVSPFKLALGAVAAAVVLNLILRILFKLEGMPITIIVAGTVGLLVWFWITKRVRRPLTGRERTQFLMFYTVFLAALCVALISLAIADNSFNLGGLVILTLHFIVYPFVARMVLADDLSHLFKKET